MVLHIFQSVNILYVLSVWAVAKNACIISMYSIISIKSHCRPCAVHWHLVHGTLLLYACVRVCVCFMCVRRTTYIRTSCSYTAAVHFVVGNILSNSRTCGSLYHVYITYYVVYYVCIIVTLFACIENSSRACALRRCVEYMCVWYAASQYNRIDCRLFLYV